MARAQEALGRREEIRLGDCECFSTITANCLDCISVRLVLSHFSVSHG